MILKDIQDNKLIPKKDLCIMGEINFRNTKRRFGIKLDDRRRHIYSVGKTGMGKTEFLKSMAIQDILVGHGVAFIDPHGDAADSLLDFIPEQRQKDVIYFNPSDVDYPIAFNIMENVDYKNRHLVAGGLLGIFKKLWPDVWSPRMEYILNNCILALLETPDATLLGINKLLANEEYRKKVLTYVKDPVVKSFWLQEFARYTQRYEVEATAAVQNKIGQFISIPLIRNIVGQKRSTIDIRKIMDEGKILIVNISKGKIGEDQSNLLGGLIITKLQLAAMSRVDIPEDERKDFFLYVDEFQNFATKSFATILSEARKYRLSIILTHQYISQMEESVRDAVFGNVGTIVCFRVGAEDAEFLQKEFDPVFTAEDLVNLPKYNMYVKLMVDGITQRPFSARTLPPFKPPELSFRKEVIENSRKQYAVEREKVEKEILAFIGEIKEPPQRLKLYDAICSNCGRREKVPIDPSVSPPLCKSCRKKMGLRKEQKIQNQASKANTISNQDKKPDSSVQEQRVSQEPPQVQPPIKKAGLLKPGDKVIF